MRRAWHYIVAVVVTTALASSARAATYYVDPATGDNVDSGTSPASAWKNPPGTRTTANSAFISTQWGAVATSNKVACGDTILLKAGSTQTSAQGGGWLIDPTYYSTSCTAANPITIRVASVNGSSGPFTLNASGMTLTCKEPPGFCDHPAAVYITAVSGVVLKGADSSQRLVVHNAGPSSGSWLIIAACNVAGGCTGLSDFRGQWWELRDSALAFDIGVANNWQVSDSIAHNIGGNVWTTGLNNDNFVSSGAFVDVEAADSGCGSLARPTCTNDGFSASLNLLGGKSLWCVRCSVHGSGIVAVSTGVIRNENMGGDFFYRFRDFISYDNGFLGRACNGNACGGFKSSGNEWANGDLTRTTVTGAMVWGNWSFGFQSYHHDSLEVWNATTYHNSIGRPDLGSYDLDTTGGDFRIFNGIDVLSAGARAFSQAPNNSNGAVPQQQFTPLVRNTCFRPLSSNAERLGAATGTGWPGAGTYGAPPSWIDISNKTTLETCNPQLVALDTNSFSANDFRLCESAGNPTASCTSTSSAIDAGRSYLLTNGAGSGNTIAVKANGGSSDPRNYLIAQTGSYLDPLPADTEVQIEGDCGVRHIVSMTATTITIDGASCTWANNAMVHTPWTGAAPDMGALESGLDNGPPRDGGGDGDPPPMSTSQIAGCSFAANANATSTGTLGIIVAIAFAFVFFRRRIRKTATRFGSLYFIAFILVSSLASPVRAATYYVDPATGDNADNGTSPGTAWKNPPGTRNTANTDYYSSSWGSINGTTRIACGDVVLFRPGRTQTSSEGGAWCIASNGDTGGAPICNEKKRFYATGCDFNNPVTFRIATPNEWPGAPATGDFTIDGAGITGTQPAGVNFDGTLVVGLMDGFVLQGLDANRRFVIEGAQNRAAGSGVGCAAYTATTSGSYNTDIVLDWVELTGGSRGLCVGDADKWRVSHALIHGNQCHGIDIGMHVDKKSDRGALVDVEVYGNGISPGCVPFNSDGIYQQGVRRQWNIRVSVHDEQSNCINGGSGRQNGSPPQDATFRAIWRDSEFYKCGITTTQNARAGIAWDGDGDVLAPHSYVFFQRPVVYGTPGSGIWTNHGTGRMNMWNATAFANAWAGTGGGVITYERSGDIFELHNSLIVPRSYTAGAISQNASTTIFDVKPLSNYNLFDFVTAATEGVSSFRWNQAWPTIGSFQSSGVTFSDAASQLGFSGGSDYFSTDAQRYSPRFASVGGGCDNPGALTYADCDFRLCEGQGVPTSECTQGSDAIDKGTFFLRANAAGSGNTISVKRGDNLSAKNGTDADALAEFSDPRNFFVAPNSFPGAVGDTIQIGGQCGRRNVTALTATTITFDGSVCSWESNAGIHLPWEGAAPDIGAYESGLDTGPPRDDNPPSPPLPPSSAGGIAGCSLVQSYDATPFGISAIIFSGAFVLLLYRWRARSFFERPGSFYCVAIISVSAFTSSARANTYYVDPATGNNANNGTSAATSWRNPPSTRNTANSAFTSSSWGAITTSNKIACGDMILLKGGATQTSAQGGAWCIASNGGCAFSGTYYANTCSGDNPITIRVATGAEWPGSSGPFTLAMAGITPASSASFNYAGAITISKLSGVTIAGASAEQRIKINMDSHASSGNVDTGVEVDGFISGVTLKHIEVYNNNGVGIAMGDVSDSLASDLVLHNNNGPAINCGQQVNHNCNRVGWINITAYDNSYAPSGPFYCDALYIQGAQQLYVINANVHDNGCNGMNIGAGNHAYPYPARTIIRDSVFSHNGLWNDNSNSKANFQGGGDGFPSEVGAPSHGYCSGGPNEGAVCTDSSACGGLSCSFYDAYSIFERVVSFGAMSAGAYVHHGSGFTWLHRMTIFNNNLGGYYSGQIVDDRVASDHILASSVVVNRPNQTLLNYNSNGIHPVCRQNCPNAGQPCNVNADCGSCASTTTPACGQYLPMMAIKNSLLRPSLPAGTDNESLTYIRYKCDASCTGGTAGMDCASDSDCAGCAGGCNWDNSGSSFANVASNASFINDASNKIGAAFDPQFVSIDATGCANGTDASACDFHLQEGSTAIDAGTFLMLTKSAGSNSFTVAVKENVASRGLNFNGKNSDPNTFFIPQNGYLGYAGDTIQIEDATCSPAGNPRIVSMTTSAIHLDRNCKWSAGKGVDLPWAGAAPDMGAYEFGDISSGPPRGGGDNDDPPPTSSSSHIAGCSFASFDDATLFGTSVLAFAIVVWTVVRRRKLEGA